MSPKLKFYMDGLLRIWNLGDILRQNVDGDMIEADDSLFVPKVPISPDIQTLPNRFWVHVEDTDRHAVYRGDDLMFRYDPIAGNLIFGFNDISILTPEKGGTGVESIEELIALFELGNAAFLNTGTGINNVLKFTTANQLPALDGSLLTGLSAIPTGSIFYFPVSAAPTGFLKVNGALISRTTYADLYAKIGTTFGVGDGSTTFQLPDVRGEFLRCWDDGRGIDNARALGSFQGDAMRNFTGYFGNDSTPDSGLFYASGAGGGQGGDYRTSTLINFDPSRVVPTAAENRPRNVAMLACIKY